jgi:enterochelin esterase family protein
MMPIATARRTLFPAATAIVLTTALAAQTPPTAPVSPAQGRGPQTPPVVSPEVSADRRVTFRILAPTAQAIRLNATDIPGLGQKGVLTKGDNGVWTLTVGPLEPGAYRYNFNVDGVAVIDPRSPAISESNNNIWSVAYVAGSDLFDTKPVPHGAVAAVTYYSTALQRHRRMHVYTPPGYESGAGKYPVFYLLHGAGDNDDAWTSVGRAGAILDNLIAAKRARPMIVVMPAGHTNGPQPGVGPPVPARAVQGAPDEFVRDFTTDVVPYVEKHYRVLSGRPNRAIAGLSMGGMQTLNIAIPHLDRFAYIGVFSSGLLGGGRGGRGAAPDSTTTPAQPPPPFGAAFEKQHAAMLGNASLKKGLKLVWFSTGRDDGLIATTRSTVELLEKHGFSVEYIESAGGHTWINWRNYLVQFAPRLFR